MLKLYFLDSYSSPGVRRKGEGLFSNRKMDQSPKPTEGYNLYIKRFDQYIYIIYIIFHCLCRIRGNWYTKFRWSVFWLDQRNTVGTIYLHYCRVSSITRNISPRNREGDGLSAWQKSVIDKDVKSCTYCCFVGGANLKHE